ncbi:hypothetical protein [Tolypothrix sp. VBCCA 56010]|uniref:hypothetical protein n=1 Tax=Tolypothrix sp. VBCCA 56010 TaxID=3137731 RepID=UPI003D7D19E1
MNKLFLDIETFYDKLQAGEFDEPLALAGVLQKLASAGWQQVDQMYQPSIQIDS